MSKGNVNFLVLPYLVGWPGAHTIYSAVLAIEMYGKWDPHAPKGTPSVMSHTYACPFEVISGSFCTKETPSS